MRSTRARFTWASIAGAASASAVFAWVAFLGRADALIPEVLGNFYDAQARSLLDGHWDMPAKVLTFERFKVDGKFFTYFGPWPAILRMPVIAFTDEFNGRLARISMLIAFMVLLAFTARLAWQARLVVRGDRPLGWRSLLAVGGYVFVVGCGSTALFLGSRAYAQHEAILWGAAWAVASLSFLVAYMTAGRVGSLLWACVAATLGLLSRPSVALGPLIALGIVLAVRVVQRILDRRSERRANPRSNRRRFRLARRLGVSPEVAQGSIWQVAVAVAVPVALYAYVNYAKFGSFFGVPIDKQDIQLRRPERRAVLANTGNSLFGLDYLPTNLVQYLRPDAIGFRHTFPWVTFSTAPDIFGGVVFDSIEPSASVTASAILLFVLVVFGVIAAIRAVGARRNAREVDAPGEEEALEEGTAARFRIPLIAVGLGSFSSIAIADLYQRYEGDFLPLLIVGSALGLFWVIELAVRRSPRSRRWAAVALVVAGLWSCWVNFGLALIYQREYSGLPTVSLRPGFVGFQLDVNDALGLGPPPLRRGAKLPTTKGQEFNPTKAHHGELFVLGDCEGFFISNGRAWEPIEEKLPGQRLWNVTFGQALPGSREPLWSAGTGPYHILWAHWIDSEHVRLEYQSTDADDTLEGSAVLRVHPKQRYEFLVRLDPKAHYIEIAHRNRLLLRAAPRSFDTAAQPRLGQQPDAALGATKWRATISETSLTPLCDRLTR